MKYALVFLVSMIFVGTKSFQQLNVTFKKFKWVAPASLLMAFCEVFIITSVVTSPNALIAIAMGLGAALGCMISMYYHPKITGKGYGRIQKEVS